MLTVIRHASKPFMRIVTMNHSLSGLWYQFHLLNAAVLLALVETIFNQVGARNTRHPLDNNLRDGEGLGVIPRPGNRRSVDIVSQDTLKGWRDIYCEGSHTNYNGLLTQFMMLPFGYFWGTEVIPWRFQGVWWHSQWRLSQAVPKASWVWQFHRPACPTFAWERRPGWGYRSSDSLGGPDSLKDHMQI